MKINHTNTETMKTLLFSFLLLLFTSSVIGQTQSGKLIAETCEGRGCTGSEYCSACKNCSGCKHCAKNGGTCGVCSAPVKKVAAAPKKTMKKKSKSKNKKKT
jgi:hypothetical protein